MCVCVCIYTLTFAVTSLTNAVIKLLSLEVCGKKSDCCRLWSFLVCVRRFGFLVSGLVVSVRCAAETLNLQLYTSGT